MALRRRVWSGKKEGVMEGGIILGFVVLVVVHMSYFL